MKALLTISAMLAHMALACLIGVLVSFMMMPDNDTVKNIVRAVCGVQ